MNDDQLHIYVENRRDAKDVFTVREAQIRAALGPHAGRARIAIRPSDEPDLKALAQAGYFIGSGFDPRRIAAAGKRLKLVHCLSAGVEAYLPLDWLRDGLVLTNSSGAHAEKGGQYGLMAVLMLNERLPELVTSQRAHHWNRALSSSICGKTAVFLGTGALASAVAACLRPLSVRCIGLSRTGAANPEFDACFEAGALHDWLPQADFLIVAAPLTDATRGAIGATEIGLLPAHAGVLNIGRAAVVDYDALCAALSAGTLAGAVLDVFDPEPLPDDSPLWDTPNLIITPHTSCDDHAHYVERCLAIFGDNIDRMARGHALRNIVDPKEQY